MSVEARIRSSARVAIGLVATSAAVLVAGYQFGPERSWPFALAQYVPYPAFLAPCLVALALSAALGWAWRVAAIFSVILVSTSVSGFELNRGESGVLRLRVMTYNIKDYITSGRADGLTEVAREVSRHDPDVVVLQDARRLAEHPEAAQAILGGRQRYFFGQYVVASRFPLRECGRREMPFREEAHTYVSCIVAVNGVEFDLLTAHFITPRSGLSAVRFNLLGGIEEWRQNVSDRLTQAEGLARDVRTRRRPVIVAGDLNAPETSLVVRALLDEGLRDAFSVAGVGFGHTWGHSLRFRFSFLRIDHILVGPEFGVGDCFVGGALGSEHRPVIADLYLTRDES